MQTNLAYALDQSTGFQAGTLTRAEKEALGIARYGRPYRVQGIAQGDLYEAGKRLFDVVFAALALAVLSPLILVSMLAIYLEDPHGSPIFKQQRVGCDGRPFELYKLRSMCCDAEAKLADLMKDNEFHGKAFKIKNDPRITKVGHVLRNTSIDELPQLVNILRGEMSFVGPRPPLPREVALYDEYEKQRLLVKPGLTCFWQVYPERHEIDFDDWVAMDLKYIEQRSWRVDLELIVATVLRVLKGHAD